MLAEEIVAMVGTQLGRVGPDSVLKGEKLHLQPTLSPWDAHFQFCHLHNTPPPGLAERAEGWGMGVLPPPFCLSPASAQ